MSYTLSPNMSLTIPGVGTQPGPDYAENVNASLTLIDQHDHTPGRGIQITPDGLNINSSLDMQDNSLVSLASLIFETQTDISTDQTLFVKSSGSINDLYFNDGNGTEIQITKDGLVNATVGSLPGQSYAAGTFIWKQGDGSTTPADFDIGSITLRPNTAGTTNGVTLSPPAAISSAYTLLMPADPGALSGPYFLTLDSDGTMAAYTPIDEGIDTNNIADGAITAAKLNDSAYEALNTWQEQVFLSSGNFTVPDGVNRIFLRGAGGGGGGGCGIGVGGGVTGGGGGMGAHPTEFSAEVTPGATYAVVIGTGGAGSVSPSARGGGGTNTSIAIGDGIIFRGAEGGYSGGQGGTSIGGSWFSNWGGNGGVGAFVSGLNGNGSLYASGGTGAAGQSGAGGGGGGGAGFGAGANGGLGATTGNVGQGGSSAGANSSAGGGGGGGADTTHNPGGGGNGGSGMLIISWLPGAS